MIGALHKIRDQKTPLGMDCKCHAVVMQYLKTYKLCLKYILSHFLFYFSHFWLRFVGGSDSCVEFSTLFLRGSLKPDDFFSVVVYLGKG